MNEKIENLKTRVKSHVEKHEKVYKIAGVGALAVGSGTAGYFLRGKSIPKPEGLTVVTTAIMRNVRLGKNAALTYAPVFNNTIMVSSPLTLQANMPIPVLLKETGELFPSIAKAAANTGIPRRLITDNVRGVSPDAWGKTFEAIPYLKDCVNLTA